MKKQMTLGQLIDALEAAPDRSQRITYELCGIVPTKLDSYRGYYDQLALGLDASRHARLTVAELLEDAKAALTTTFHGYKGGTYRMNRETPLWAANYGDCWDTAIVGVRFDSYQATIETEKQEI